MRACMTPTRNTTKKILIDIYNALLSHFGHRGWWPGDTKLEVCVGAILTQNTAWKNVEKAINNMKAQGLLSIEGIHQSPLNKIIEAIRPTGYYNQKAERLKIFVGYIVNRYNGDIDGFLNNHRDPKRLREELLNIKGIGKETADSIILYAANLPVFVIDAYTKRIVSRVFTVEDLPDKILNDYDRLQTFFELNLPKDLRLYNDYHAQLVELGKRYCRKIALCNRNGKLCPIYNLCHRTVRP